ncbi:hypothetical protein F511_37162 [Dorcoceras hygrometricum]|uniref:HHO5-like N-terminal domain-containing protein n=1 Tax=Dorcoceras hygrometricum TaxID=472368 RepID=A0A2Z7CQW8_9LAMI|nr:hypothetical protein F511_37162 [Dorcoceras hygrometricum]
MTETYKEEREKLESIYVPKTIAQILTDVSTIDGFSRKLMILEFHVQAIEEELRRTSASKHPRYYSFHFLKDAIEILKQEILMWKRREKKPVVQQLMPVENGCGGCSGTKESADINDKREWMSSVRLWTIPVHHKSVSLFY